MNTDARTISPKKQLEGQKKRGRPRKVRPNEPALVPPDPEEAELRELQAKFGVASALPPQPSTSLPMGTITFGPTTTTPALPSPVKKAPSASKDPAWRKQLATALLLRLVEFNGKINSDYEQIVVTSVNKLEALLGE